MKMYRYLIKFNSLFFIFIFLLSCDPDETGIEVITNRTAEEVKEDFSKLVINEGVNDIILESAVENVFWKFRIIAPSGTSITNKKPLIFNLHGGARTIAPDAHKTTDCLISPGLNGIIDPFIISPNSNGMLWFEQSNQVQILALYDLATTYLNIDKDKVAITGYSDGGNGSWFFAQFYPTMFSAAIPMATSYNTASANGTVSKITIPLYVIHGADDQLFPLQTTQNFVDASINAGSDIQFIIADNLDHYSVCDYVPYFRDAANWLSANVWN